MRKNILNEISPLSEQDCFYIVERHKTEFTYPLHQHREFELNFIEGGRGITRVVGDSSEEISDYELVLVGGEELIHGWLQGSRPPLSADERPIREITIQFSPEVLPPSLLAKTPFSSIAALFLRAANGVSFPLSAIMRVYSRLNRLSSIESRFQQVLLILDILHDLSQSEGSRMLSSSTFAHAPGRVADSRRIGRVEEYMQSHYAEPIRLHTLADIAGMSPIAFSRFFKLRAGRSVSDYLIDMRLGVASRLLIDSSKSVAEICYECGFNNLSNFNRIFKKRKGITPKGFRESYSKKRIIC